MSLIVTYTTPPGDYQRIFADILDQSHTLIAGQTGSGKSVIVNGIIHAALLRSPAECQLILIDPKKIELYQYRQMPHTIRYSSDCNDMFETIHTAEHIMDARFAEIQHHAEAGLRQYSGGHIYVIIDELADLIDTTRAAAPIIARIGRLGRAARVHLIVATQYLGRTIPPEIKRNLTSVIGLHTRTIDDSRYLIDQRGCEQLHIGECLYLRPADAAPQQVRIPYAGDDAQAAETRRLLDWWTDPAHIQTRATPEERREILRRIYGH